MRLNTPALQNIIALTWSVLNVEHLRNLRWMSTGKSGRHILDLTPQKETSPYPKNPI